MAIHEDALDLGRRLWPLLERINPLTNKAGVRRAITNLALGFFLRRSLAFQGTLIALSEARLHDLGVSASILVRSILEDYINFLRVFGPISQSEQERRAARFMAGAQIQQHAVADRVIKLAELEVRELGTKTVWQHFGGKERLKARREECKEIYDGMRRDIDWVSLNEFQAKSEWDGNTLEVRMVEVEKEARTEKMDSNLVVGGLVEVYANLYPVHSLHVHGNPLSMIGMTDFDPAHGIEWKESFPIQDDMLNLSSALLTVSCYRTAVTFDKGKQKQEALKLAQELFHPDDLEEEQERHA